ncbi:DUF2851 family protein [bacterium]|nr:DUF2851 family protein [bacterium]
MEEEGHCFSDRYYHLRDEALLVREKTPERVSERLVRCIWLDQLIKKNRLKTLDGRRIKVISPGWWNTGEGADFRQAEIEIEGKRLKGEIEAHVYTSDWKGHGHHRDPRYGKVILHIALWDNRNKKFIRDIKDRVIPQLILSPYLSNDLEILKESISPEKYPLASSADFGPCYPEIKEADPGKITQFLNLAGDARILEKAEYFRRRADSVGWEESLYGGIMIGLGYKGLKGEFLELAQRVTIKDIRGILQKATVKEKVKSLQALFFGVSGLLPEVPQKGYDRESTRYLQKLRKLWERMPKRFQTRVMEPQGWRSLQMRPANLPSRRIAGVSHLLASYSNRNIFNLFKKAIINQKILLQYLLRVFNPEEENYWSYRYTWGGRRKKRPVRLIGKERVVIILVNALIPAMLAYARKKEDRGLEEILHRIYTSQPSSGNDRVTKFVTHHLFGKKKINKEALRFAQEPCFFTPFKNSARHQQALYQIFNDYCGNEKVGCTHCNLTAILHSLT